MSEDDLHELRFAGLNNRDYRQEAIDERFELLEKRVKKLEDKCDL